LATPRVPASVIAPVVPVDGVRPVVPALNDVTALDESVSQDGAAPVLPTNTWPVVPTAVAVKAEVPLPSKTPFDVSVDAPVPPLTTVKSFVSTKVSALITLK